MSGLIGLGGGAVELACRSLRHALSAALLRVGGVRLRLSQSKIDGGADGCSVVSAHWVVAQWHLDGV
jgi:hypothetical protein